MGISVSSDVILGQSGSLGVVFTIPGGALFSQLFDGTPQFYPGSLVQIQEIVTIFTEVVDESLVDVDFGWFVPRRYLGSYQLSSAALTQDHYEDDDGYLVDTIQKIRRYSWYTITANPATLAAQHEQISLDSCNFYTTPDVFLFPGENTPTVGSRLKDLRPALLGSITLSKAPLVDRPFNRKIGGVGVHLRPGVQGVSVTYEAAVINALFTDYPAVEAPQCIFLPANCQGQFAAELLNHPGDWYESLSECQTVSGVGCVANTWVCPSDGTQVFTYYQPQAV